MIDFKANKISSPIGLMLDNLVYNRHGEIHFLRINDLHAFDHPDMGGNYGLYGIPLTEEWLIKMGFVRDRHGWELPKTQFSLTEQLYPCWLDKMLWPQDIPDFKKRSLASVHQIQNMAFALTGEELTIKL